MSLGWAAGITPGPLSALVLTTALQRGFAAGTRVAIAPLLTDAPIVALSVAVLSTLSGGVLRVLSLAGALYLVGLGVQELRASRRAALLLEGGVGGRARDVGRGVATNLLSPHPWLFWVTVGGPTLVRAWNRAPVAGAGFLAGFFVLLVGTKLAIAFMAARGRRRLDERTYRLLVAAGGVVILVAGLVLLVEGSGLL